MIEKSAFYCTQTQPELHGLTSNAHFVQKVILTTGSIIFLLFSFLLNILYIPYYKALTLFLPLPAMGGISPYMSLTWQQLVGIGLKHTMQTKVHQKCKCYCYFIKNSSPLWNYLCILFFWSALPTKLDALFFLNTY